MKGAGLPELSLAETTPDLPPPLPPLSEESERKAWRHRAALVLSILIHLALIAGLVYFARVPAPVTFTAIPVTLVPPPKPVTPVPKPAAKKPPPPHKQAARKPPPPHKPPPRGNLASVEIGNPDAPRDSTTVSDAPASGEAAPKPGSDQPKTTGNAAPAMPAATPEPATLGQTAPQPKAVPHALAKEGGARLKTHPGPRKIGGHHAEVPGPDASQDAYLAYLQNLVMRNWALLAPDQVGGRSGGGELGIVVLRSGAIAWITVKQSSGWTDMDKRAEEMVNRAGNFPPLPRYMDAPSVELTFDFHFPLTNAEQ